MDAIDWEQLRREVRLKHGWDVDDESFGTEESRLALCHLIGDEALRAAVDCIVDMLPAGEMARCALMILRPAVAVERCLEIFRTDPDRQRRLMAAGALSWVASYDDLPIVQELFEDSDPAVQAVGATVLDQLIFTGHAHTHQAEPYLRLAEDHSNPEVQTAAANIRDYLERRGIPRVEPPTGDPAEGHCAICGVDLDDSPAIRWTSLPHLVWHLACEMTDNGRAWFEGLRRQHPALDREVTLGTMGQEQRCPACSAVQLVNPTAVGHDPSGWAVNGSSCGEAWMDAINGYQRPDLYAELMRLRLQFERGDWDWRREMELVALDAQLPARPDRRECECGGRFSFSARVRCLSCKAVLPIDSWFHTAFIVSQPSEQMHPWS